MIRQVRFDVSQTNQNIEAVRDDVNQNNQNLAAVREALNQNNQNLASVREDLNQNNQSLAAVREDLQTLRDSGTTSNSISRISSANLDQKLKDLNISRPSDDAVWDNRPVGFAPEPFEWLPQKEDNERNVQKYMMYLRNLFSLPDNCILVNVCSQQNLLDTNTSVLPNGGPIDVVLIPGNISPENNPIEKIFLGIELKKSLKPTQNASHFTQVAMQLLNACCLYPDTGVVILLTDLNEVWRFFWLGPNRNILRCNTSIVEAQFLVKNLLNPEVGCSYPEFFLSRASWNELFPGDNNSDQDDGRDRTVSDSKDSSANDNNSKKKGNGPGESKDIDHGSPNAFGSGNAVKGAGTGNASKTVGDQDKWKDVPDMSNVLDIMDLLDAEERRQIQYSLVILSTFPDIISSYRVKDYDNDGKPNLTKMNVLRHDNMLKGSHRDGHLMLSRFCEGHESFDGLIETPSSQPPFLDALDNSQS